MEGTSFPSETSVEGPALPKGGGAGRSVRAMALAATLLLWCCAGDTPAAGAGSDAVTEAPVPRWILREVLRLGSPDGPPEATFGSVRGVERSPDGSILVLDQQASEIRRFGPDGTFLEVLARAGQGPGELSGPNGLVLDHEGSLWVNDLGNARIKELRNGQPLRSVVVPVAHVEMPTLSYRQWLGTVTRDGRVWDVSTRRRGALPEGLGVLRWTTDVAVQGRSVDDAGGSTRDSTWTGSFPEASLAFPRGVARIPFHPLFHVAMDPAGFVWTAWGGGARLTRQTLEGDTVQVIDLPLEAAPVGAGERQAEVRRLEEFMEVVGRVPVEWDEVIPDSHAMIEQLAVDDRSHVWVRTRSPDGQAAYLVVDASGGVVARAAPAFPVTGGFIPRIRDGYFLTVVRDELDVEYVVVAEVVGG